MAHIQNEDFALMELNFRAQTEDGKIRNPTIKEEFDKVIKEFKISVEKVFIDSISEEYFSKTSAVSRVHSYLNIMHKNAGKEIDVFIEHFTNVAVYAFIFENITDTTLDKLHRNQNTILFLSEERQPLKMHMEIWR